MDLTKICTKCRTKKEFKAFSKDKTTKDGFRPICKICIKDYSKSYYAEKRHDISTKKKKYYKDNRCSINTKQKSYYEKNKEITASYQRIKRSQDPLYRLKSNTRNLIKNSFKRGSFKKTSKTANILGCSFKELQTHLRTTFEVNYGLPFSQIDTVLLHVDHIIPLSSAKTKEDLIKLNHYSNLQYLFAEDNLEKGDSLDWRL